MKTAIREIGRYIGRHWRGEQNIIWSLLVNGVAVYAALIGLAVMLAVLAGVPDHIGAWIFTPFIVAWLVWMVVGSLRAAIATLRDRQSHWVLKAAAILAFVGFALILYAIFHDLQILRDWRLR
jgi:hypothetical protein